MRIDSPHDVFVALAPRPSTMSRMAAPTPRLHCPNCSGTVERQPIVCDACGYRSDMASEYLWLYAVGGFVLLLGMATGVAGVMIQGNARGAASGALEGWFPLGPWPRDFHWLAVLVAGILLTLVGMGLTRRFRSAYWAGLVLVVFEIVFTGRKLVAEAPPPQAPALAGTLLAVEVVFLAVLVRVGIALRRTPPRDVDRVRRRLADRGDLKLE